MSCSHLSDYCSTEVLLEKSGMSVAPPKRLRSTINALPSKPAVILSENGETGVEDVSTNKMPQKAKRPKKAESVTIMKNVVKNVAKHAEIVTDNPANEDEEDEEWDDEDKEQDAEDDGDVEDDGDRDKEDGDKDKEDKDKDKEDKEVKEVGDEGMNQRSLSQDESGPVDEELQGASRTTGSIFRGKAKGNMLNVTSVTPLNPTT
jgi:hypothetical protein